MPLTGNENHDITLLEGAEMTKRFRNTLPSGGGTLGHYIGKQTIEDILSQQGCVGIRIYYALDSSQNKQLVITGVNSAGDDLYLGILADKTLRCPSVCATPNPLNSDLTP